MSEHKDLNFELDVPADEALLDLREDIWAMEAPEGLDSYIEFGIAQGQALRRKKIRRGRLMLAACLLIAALLVPIRVSPAYAALVSKIPGLEYIVRLINYDRGLVSAVQNNFVQHINLSDEHEGVVFTVKDIIIDESRMVMFYSLVDKGKHKPIDISEFRFFGPDGTGLAVCSTWDGLIGQETHLGQGVDGKVELSCGKDTVLPSQIIVKARLREALLQDSAEREPSPNNSEPGTNPEKGKLLEPTWQVAIPVNRKMYQDLKDEYVLNHTVTVEGQKLTFTKVTIYPTRISIDVEFDPANTKKIFYFDDLCLVDEKGNKVAGIINGISGSQLDGTHQTLYFQSNYFDKPREIYLEGHSIRALDKALLDVKVDLINKKAVGQLPDRLTLVDVKQSPGEWEIDWKLKVDPPDQSRGYSLFDSLYNDVDGREQSEVQSGVVTGTTEQQIYIVIPNKEAVSRPITLHINDYPSRIKGDFRVKIK